MTPDTRHDNAPVKERDSHVIITSSGPRESHTGAVVAVVLALFALVLIGFFLLYDGVDEIDVEAPMPDSIEIQQEEAPNDGPDTVIVQEQPAPDSGTQDTQTSESSQTDSTQTDTTS